MHMRHQKSHDRYQNDKGSKFMQYISKELVYGRGSTYDKSRSRTNSRVFANNTKIKPNDSFQVSDVYSQPQLVKQRRGASILRSSSKSKCRDSMSKFRKDFVKEASFNFYEGKEFKESVGSKLSKDKRVKSTKDDTTGTGVIGMIFDEDLDVEEIHYQMAKMHQNVKLMQKET